MKKIKILIGDDDRVSDIFISDNPNNSFVLTKEKTDEEIVTPDDLDSEIDGSSEHDQK